MKAPTLDRLARHCGIAKRESPFLIFSFAYTLKGGMAQALRISILTGNVYYDHSALQRMFTHLVILIIPCLWCCYNDYFIDEGTHSFK